MSVIIPTFRRTNSTIALSASPVSSSAAIGFGQNVLITNEGPNTIFVELGSVSVTATTGSTPILAGSQAVIRRDLISSYVAAITAIGTASVYVTPGEGE